MKRFLIAAVSIIAVLLIYMSVRHDFGQKASLPVDFEQEGLNEQIVINFSHVVAENTPKGLTADKFAKLVEEKTNGVIQVEVYPNSTLYSDGEELQVIQNGDVEMIAPSFSKVTDWIPTWQVLDLPYLFENHEDIEEIFTGPIKEELLGMLDEYDVKGLAFWNNGFKQITTAHSPVKLPNNLAGLTLRTMPSNMLERQMRLVDAESRSASFDQVYRLLESKKLDGQENTISNIDSKGFYQVQDHMTLSNHGILGYAVMINNDFWNSLPKNLQQAVIEAMDEATAWNLTQSELMNRESLKKLEASDELKIHHLTEKELQQWQQTFMPLYDYYRNQIDEKLLKKIQKSIN